MCENGKGFVGSFGPSEATCEYCLNHGLTRIKGLRGLKTRRSNLLAPVLNPACPDKSGFKATGALGYGAIGML